MKHRAKKSIAGDRIELQKTGGGSFVSQVDDVDHKMLSLLGHRAVPLANAFDSDAASDHNGAYNFFSVRLYLFMDVLKSLVPTI